MEQDSEIKTTPKNKKYDIVPILELITPIHIGDEKKRELTKVINQVNAMLENIKNVPLAANDVRILTVCGLTYVLERVEFGTPYNSSLGIAVGYGRQMANGKLYGIEISESYFYTVVRGIRQMERKIKKQSK